MSYLALARQWRPQTFEDLIGQAHVVQTLKNAIRFERISHAYLFSGARGVGKTSVARIFSKALRCPEQKDGIPCNECPECVLITEGRSVDVSEIDGASHNGVEAVRSIRDNVAYAPANGRYKIYIIDEVHMLSVSAFNALLKTLEEPPPHVVFMFATTESQKIPLTILSRCQRFEFRRLTQTQIVERVSEILKKENRAIADTALRTLAAYSDGSMRDALSLLDQVFSHHGNSEGGQPISEAELVAALGISPSSSITEYVGSLCSKDVPKALEIIDGAYNSGVDLKHFLERVLEELRFLYLVSVSRDNDRPITAEDLDISVGRLETLQKYSLMVSSIQIERIAQVFNRVSSQLTWASQPRFVLEMASVRLCHLGDLAVVESVLTAAKGQVAQVSSMAKPTLKPPPPPKMEVKAPIKPAPARPIVSPVSPKPVPKVSEAPQAKIAVKPATPSSGAPPLVDDIPMPTEAPPDVGYMRHAENLGQPQQKSWEGFVDFVTKKRPLLGALLSHGDFHRVDGKTVELKFAKNSFFERQAMDPSSRQGIEELVKRYFGPETVLNLGSAGSQNIRSLERSRQMEQDNLKKNALEHPSVLKAQEVLGAQVIQVSVMEQEP